VIYWTLDTLHNNKYRALAVLISVVQWLYVALTDEVVEAVPAMLRRIIDMLWTRPAERIDDESMMTVVWMIGSGPIEKYRYKW
jgi:hypothetical protein